MVTDSLSAAAFRGHVPLHCPDVPPNAAGDESYSPVFTTSWPSGFPCWFVGALSEHSSALPQVGRAALFPPWPTAELHLLISLAVPSPVRWGVVGHGLLLYLMELACSPALRFRMLCPTDGLPHRLYLLLLSIILTQLVSGCCPPLPLHASVFLL